MVCLFVLVPIFLLRKDQLGSIIFSVLFTLLLLIMHLFYVIKFMPLYKHMINFKWNLQNPLKARGRMWLVAIFSAKYRMYPGLSHYESGELSAGHGILKVLL